MRRGNRGLALALGGGAARGLAHLGVLRILEEEGIGADLIVGTSAGSVAGAVYSLNPDIDKALQTFRVFFASPAFRNAKIHVLRKKGELDEEEGWWDSVSSYLKRGLAYTSSVTKRSILDWEEIQGYLAGLMDPKAAFGDCKIPYAAVATSLRTGMETIITTGSLFNAVAASSAIPGFFPPVMNWDGQELIDGGTTSMVPVTAAQELGARAVIAVNVSSELTPDPSVKRSLEIIIRANEITKFSLLRSQLKQADLVLTPDVGGIHWADFGRIEDYIKAGERAALDALPEIRSLKRRSRRLWRFGRAV